MAHRLAVVAGELDVDKVLRQLPEKKFRRWVRYYEIEPFGTRRDNLHAAIVAKMLADLAGAKTEKGERFTLEDLMLRTEAAARKPSGQTVEQKIAIAYAIAAAFNPNVKAKDA